MRAKKTVLLTAGLPTSPARGAILAPICLPPRSLGAQQLGLEWRRTAARSAGLAGDPQAASNSTKAKEKVFLVLTFNFKSSNSSELSQCGK